MKTQLLILVLLLVAGIGSATGYARASVWGGNKAYRLNSLFAELALQGEFSHSKAFMAGDVRLRKGNNFGSPYQTVS